MDDLGERLGALEAEMRAEMRNVRSEVAIEIRALRSEVAAAIKGLDHLDECLERRLKETSDNLTKMMGAGVRLMSARLETASAKLAAEIKLPKIVTWTVVSTSIVAFVGAIFAVACNFGGESRRVIQLPTSPPHQRGSDR